MYTYPSYTYIIYIHIKIAQAVRTYCLIFLFPIFGVFSTEAFEHLTLHAPCHYTQNDLNLLNGRIVYGVDVSGLDDKRKSLFKSGNILVLSHL